MKGEVIDIRKVAGVEVRGKVHGRRWLVTETYSPQHGAPHSAAGLQCTALPSALHLQASSSRRHPLPVFLW